MNIATTFLEKAKFNAESPGHTTQPTKETVSDDEDRETRNPHTQLVRRHIGASFWKTLAVPQN